MKILINLLLLLSLSQVAYAKEYKLENDRYEGMHGTKVITFEIDSRASEIVFSSPPFFRSEKVFDIIYNSPNEIAIGVSRNGATLLEINFDKKRAKIGDLFGEGAPYRFGKYLFSTIQD